MSDTDNAFGFGIVFGAILGGSICAFAVESLANSKHHAEAIAAGVAEYVCDAKTGKTIFRYTAKEVQP